MDQILKAAACSAVSGEAKIVALIHALILYKPVQLLFVPSRGVLSPRLQKHLCAAEQSD